MKITPGNGELQSAAAFDRFLNWLDQGVPSKGEKYLEIRRRLAGFFDRKGCSASDDLADQTLSRVARRLDEEAGSIDLPPAQYCYIVAKFVLLEYLRGAERRQVSLDVLPAMDRRPLPHERSMKESALSAKEKLAECLDQCLQKLSRDNRQLIEEYYRGERRLKIEHRRGLAARLGLSMNALSIKTCRIRSVLEGCVRGCSEEE